jgi:hypothetical protein
MGQRPVPMTSPPPGVPGPTESRALRNTLVDSTCSVFTPHGACGKKPRRNAHGSKLCRASRVLTYKICRREQIAPALDEGAPLKRPVLFFSASKIVTKDEAITSLCRFSWLRGEARWRTYVDRVSFGRPDRIVLSAYWPLKSQMAHPASRRRQVSTKTCAPVTMSASSVFSLQ